MAPPRTLEQRIADTLALLAEPGADIWVATASADGAAHLVPLSYGWTGDRIVLATDSTMVTARNLVDVAEGPAGHRRHTRDVVMIDAELETRASGRRRAGRRRRSRSSISPTGTRDRGRPLRVPGPATGTRSRRGGKATRSPGAR